MRSLFRFALVSVAFGCLLPALVAGDGDKKKESSTGHGFTPVGEIEVQLKAASSTSVTIQENQITLQGTGRRATPKAKPKDEVLEFTPDVKVRLMHLPLDEKGKKITRTPEELEKLKGNSNLPGYEASVSDLKAGQTVKLFLATAKGAKGDEANKLYVRRIYIEKDVSGGHGDKSDNKPKTDAKK